MCTWFRTLSALLKLSTLIYFLGLHSQTGQHYEAAFIDVTVQGKTATSLSKKIYKHRDSVSQSTCEKMLKDRENDKIGNFIYAAKLKIC